MLNDLGGEFDNFREDELGIFDDNNPLNGAPYYRADSPIDELHGGVDAGMVFRPDADCHG